jgi:hypothetical protein
MQYVIQSAPHSPTPSLSIGYPEKLQGPFRSPNNTSESRELGYRTGTFLLIWMGYTFYKNAAYYIKPLFSSCFSSES